MYRVFLIIVGLMLWFAPGLDCSLDPISHVDKDILAKAVHMDQIIQQDYMSYKAATQAQEMDAGVHKEDEIFDWELASIPIMELHQIDKNLSRRRIMSMKPKERREALKEVIKYYSDKNEIDFRLCWAVAKQESYFNPKAKSHKGARGVMQLMHGTAKEMGVEDVHHPIDNIEGGVKYLTKMLKYFRGSKTLALAAYNAGPNKVKRYRWRVPPYKETKEYVKKVKKFYREYQKSHSI